MPGAIKCRDHLGNEFTSERKMAIHWGVKPNVYSARRSRGNSIEESLTHPIKKARPPVKVTDHVGNEFDNFKSMAKAWNIDRRVLWARLYRLNWDLEKALTEPVQRRDESDLDCHE